MNDSLNKYKEVREAVKKQIAEARGFVKEAFDAGAQELLRDNPKIESFSWTQYTPFFNDGDACIFGVNSDYPDINGVNEDEDEEIPSPYSQGIRYGDPKYAEAANIYNAAQAKKYGPVKEFLRQFDDDDMEFMFGDHVKITVSKEGTEVEEYDHD